MPERKPWIDGREKHVCGGEKEQGGGSRGTSVERKLSEREAKSERERIGNGAEKVRR